MCISKREYIQKCIYLEFFELRCHGFVFFRILSVGLLTRLMGRILDKTNEIVCATETEELSEEAYQTALSRVVVGTYVLGTRDALSHLAPECQMR